MGLFSSKKTYVASSLYNLAGDEADRPNYLKTLVSGSVINNSKVDMTDSITNGYIYGPGIKMRNFYRWAVDHYDQVGVPSAKLNGISDADIEIVEGQIPFTGDPDYEAVHVQTLIIGAADSAYWAEQWMFDNHPSLIGSAWTSDINELTSQITITFADTTTATFAPVNFDRQGTYLYAPYAVAIRESRLLLSQSGATSLGFGEPFPVPAGYTLVATETSPIPGGPTGSYQVVEKYEKTAFQGEAPGVNEDEISSIVDIFYGAVAYLAGGTEFGRAYSTAVETAIHASFAPTKMFIYKLGSGNVVLDELIYDETSEGEFFPFIPLRLNNAFVDSGSFPALLTQTKKAYRKATGGRLADIITKLADNEDLDDIDYAYVMYGVPLNAKDSYSCEFLFELFERLRLVQKYDGTVFSNWFADQAGYEVAAAAWEQWRQAQADAGNPLYGSAQPNLPKSKTKIQNYIDIKGTGPSPSNLNIRLSWQYIAKTSGTGLKKVGAKAGECWTELLPNPSGNDDTKIYSNGVFYDAKKVENTRFAIHRQITLDSWETLTVTGAVHENLIYNGKSVLITGREALEDLDESGFLVPLHLDTLMDMGLVKATQIHTKAAYIVLNSYKVVKKKWYQTGIFKIFVFIAMIALTILIPPLGGAAMAAWASIGALIGLTGIAAIVAGAVIASLVSMIVMRIIGKVSIALFGEKFGQIFGAVLSVVAVVGGQTLLGGGNLSAIWGNLVSAPGLINMTTAVGNGISGYIQAAAQGIIMDTQKLMENYETESNEISQMFAQNIGYDTGWINTLGLTDTSFGNFAETPDQFVARTLLTGSDIAEMSMNMLTNFADYTVSTDLPGLG